MRILYLIALVAVCATARFASAEDAYEIDVKKPPADTYFKVGDLIPSTGLGKSSGRSAIKSTLLFDDGQFEVASKHTEVVAHLAKHNAQRFKEAALKAPVDVVTVNEETIKNVYIRVASVEEGEGTDGTKLTRYHVSISLSLDLGGKSGSAKKSEREIWEYDGKTLTLVHSGADWSYVSL